MFVGWCFICVVVVLLHLVHIPVIDSFFFWRDGSYSKDSIMCFLFLNLYYVQISMISPDFSSQFSFLFYERMKNPGEKTKEKK